MRILPFRRTAVQHCDPEARDWSQQELADFYRAHRLLVENGAGIGMDRGVSDSGDPWAVFYDLATQDSFLHVARIERSCVLVCDPLGIRLTASNVSELIATFESEVRRMLNLRTQGSATIILHPASRIIMSIAAVFLLFKFENAGAFHVKGGSGDLMNGGDFSTRKVDAGVLARIQSVVARIYDSIEAPAAVAALAGVILSVELAGITTRHSQTEVAEEDHHLARPVEPSHGTAKEVADATAVQPHEPEHVHAVTAHGRPVEAVALIEVAIDTKAAPTVVPETTSPKTAHLVASDTITPNGSDAPVLVAALPKATPSLLIGTDQQVDIGSDGAQTQAYMAVQSLTQTISTEGGRDFLAKALPAAQPAAGPDPGVADAGHHGAPQPESSLGVVYTTELSGLALLETLSQFISTLGKYDVELNGDSVMIEQDDVATLTSKEIGIWTNLMPDGSDISVVGHANLVQEVVGMFA